MAEWTVDTVAERLAEAAETARRLPPVRVQGYFNLWPPIQRQPWETWVASNTEPRPLPPAPAAMSEIDEEPFAGIPSDEAYVPFELDQPEAPAAEAAQKSEAAIARRASGTDVLAQVMAMSPEERIALFS